MEESNQPPLPPVPPSESAATTTPLQQPQAQQPISPMSTICASCGSVVPAFYTFCPNCGKSLKDQNLSTTVLKQISLYAVAIFLPPLGYWPAVKYFRNPDPKTQKLGMYLIIVTTISLIVTSWLTYALVESYIGTVNQALNGTGISPAAGILGF
jgi:hypothetical protein